LKKLISCVFLSAVLMAATAAPGLAKGKNDPVNAGCVVANGWADATGLPTNQVVNFMITDSTGTSGWVLGFTTDGTWGVSVPAQNGPTTYQFVSETWGPNGSKYTVFASC